MIISSCISPLFFIPLSAFIFLANPFIPMYQHIAYTLGFAAQGLSTPGKDLNLNWISSKAENRDKALINLKSLGLDQS